jgi:hypothetical protein
VLRVETSAIGPAFFLLFFLTTPHAVAAAIKRSFRHRTALTKSC